MEDTLSRSAYSNPEITLRDYFRTIFRHKMVVFASVIAVSATVAFGLVLQTPVYTANVKMLVSSEKQALAPYSRELIGSRGDANITQSEIVKSNPVIERAVKAVHLDKRPLDYEKTYASTFRKEVIDRQVEGFNKAIENLTPEQKGYILFRRAVDLLQRNLSVDPVRGTSLLIVSVRDFDPVVAATLANVVSRSYVIFDLEQQLAESATKYGDLHPTVTLLKSHIEGMKKTLSGEPLENIEAIGPATVKIISQASIPTLPDGKSKKLIFVLAVFLSILLGIGLSFIFEYLDPTVRSPQDLGNILKLPLLATIPEQRGAKRMLINSGKSSRAYIQAYHELACQVRLYITQNAMKTFLLTAPDLEEGTTTVAANLGLCLAKDFQQRVLIIDARYRGAGLHKRFGMAAGPGLAEVLSGQTAFNKACREIGQNLWILTSGHNQSNTENFLDPNKLAGIIDQAKKDYDIVLIDTADLRSTRETYSMANLADGLILVAAEGKTRRPAIVAAVAPLEENKFNIIGAVLNRRTFALPKFVYERV